MGRVAVIGEEVRVAGYALAGALVCPAADQEQAREAWRALPPEVEVVLLTAAAAGWLADGNGGRLAAAGAGKADGLPQRPGVLPVVLPP